MTIPPLTHPERRGYFSSLAQGLKLAFGLDDGELLRAARGQIRDTSSVLTGRRSDGEFSNVREGLAADIEAHQHAVDQVDLLAARVQRHAAVLAGAQSLAAPRGCVIALLEEADTQLDELATRSEELRADQPAPVVDDEKPSATADALMQLVDRLGAVAADSPQRDSLVDWLQRRLIETLALQGVTLIEDEGPFDPARHHIIDTSPTENPDDANRIRSTVRPGYLQGEQVLRPQQVVLWQAT